MADFPVTDDTTLERHLVRNGIQPWRIPALISSRGVLAIRGGGGGAITISGPAERLASGDLVRVVEPPTQATLTALTRAATANARDYAFVPGTSAFDEQMANVITARPQTLRIVDPLVDSLRSFVRALGGRQATAPIRHVIISSHANDEGVLFMKVDTAAAGEIQYEDLDAAVRARTLVIDPQWLTPRPQDPQGVDIPAQFLVRGCRIGRVAPYLRKLREALGNQLPVVAPKHFHIAAQMTRPAGYAEYMMYPWTLSRPAQLRNRAAVITAFQGGGFTRIDGSPVPATDWSGWIPSNPHARQQQTVQATVVNPINNARQRIPGQFRFKMRRVWETEQSIPLATDPGNESGRKAAVRADLEAAHPQYLSTHAYPVYQRWGFTSMQEFMDGFTWTFRYDSTTHTLFFNARRADYGVLRPIVDLATNRLFLNFYPTGRQGSVIELLLNTDTRFFETV